MKSQWLTGLPGHVDGICSARLPSLLSADVLGGLHHLLCGLVVLQRPLMDCYLTILQYTNLIAHTHAQKKQSSITVMPHVHGCGKHHLRLLFLGWTISLSTNPVIKANSALGDFLNSFKNQRYFLFTSHCLLPRTPTLPFQNPIFPLTTLVV